MKVKNSKRDRLTQEMIIEALRVSGGIVALAARKVGVVRQTLHEWISSEPKLQAAIDEIRQVNLDLCEAGMLKLIRDGDFRATKYYLNCFGKARGWVPTSRAEVDSTLRFEASDDARKIIARKLDELEAKNREIGDFSGTLQ